MAGPAGHQQTHAAERSFWNREGGKMLGALLLALDSTVVSLFEWSEEIEKKSSPNRASDRKIKTNYSDTYDTLSHLS